MRKVIDGKIYDTATAELLTCWTNGKYSNDFHYQEEELYKTKKGIYFLTGNGEFLSPEFIKDANYDAGYQLYVLTRQEVLEWVEFRNIDEDWLAQEFELEEG